MPNCIFCKIAGGKIPAEVVREDDELIAFEDISPKAPVHILIVPKEHLSTLNDAGKEHGALLGRMTLLAAEIAQDKGVAAGGYRVLINCNPDGGQEVFHLHMHMLGGKRMSGMG
ncbi:MAG TPA: histidine triad nucleotide-binding protein [Proteobacteria bacterium]|nr:HIT-like protein [bacterium BMS3Abin14]HDL53330.1 histidine triad nucleotide-binding protein [Pseudomonadota bacterium]